MGPSVPLASASDDRLDHVTLRIRVILDVRPLALGEFAFRSLIKLAIRLVGPQPVPEEQISLDLGIFVRQHVDLGGPVRAGYVVHEHSVLVPVRLPDTEHVPGGL